MFHNILFPKIKNYEKQTFRGRLPESYRVSTYRQDIHIELSNHVIYIWLWKWIVGKHLKTVKRLPR